MIPLWLLQKPFYALAPISWDFRLAALRGTWESLRSPHRDRLMQSLERHLGERSTPADRSRIARQYFQTRAQRQLMKDWPEIRDYAGLDAIAIEGLHHLDSALERGRGAILATAHFGHGRLIKPVLRARGYRVHLVGPEGGAPPDRRRLSRAGRFVHSKLLRLPSGSRSQRYQETSGTDLPATFDQRPSVAALERNEALTILVDGRSAQSLRPLPVLGIETYFAPGVMSIARSTEAPVLPAFLPDNPSRPGPAGMRLFIHPPLELQVTDDRRADVEENLRRFVEVYENYVRDYPHNFLWSWVQGDEFANPNRSRRVRP